MVKRIFTFVLVAALLTGCAGETDWASVPAVEIRLSDEGILVDGRVASTNESSAVYTANDIVYYEAGKDFTYGEGTEADAHTAREAAEHTVVHITKAGTYRLSGKLSKGQIAIDLGKKADDDPSAVVKLILNGADITCTVAPAVIFYNVYECGNKNNPQRDVDTSRAGANVILADGTENNISGSYVARIYKPDSVELNEDGTQVKDAKKLHKYDGAFYSKMSMNISGGGTLNITAENEGLDSEMHLTISDGNINIRSGNDGINTNEDGVSVTTISGGCVNILVTGETGEGDGIDSNGWLVIKGGTVYAAACGTSMDSGIDSDMGIHITGGTVIATGSMLDRIEEGGQRYAVFSVNGKQSGKQTLAVKDENGKTVMEYCPQNDWQILVCSSADLGSNSTLWSGDTQLATQGGMGFGGGMMPPGGFGGQPPQGQPPRGGRPEDFTRPEGMEPPQGQPPQGQPPQGRPWEEMPTPPAK